MVAICPRAGLHDQRVKTIRDSYQRGEHEGATSLRPGKQHRWQLHLITTRPGAGKVKQGAAACADPGYGRELWNSMTTERKLVPSHLLLAAVRRAHLCRTVSRTDVLGRLGEKTHAEQKRWPSHIEIRQTCTPTVEKWADGDEYYFYGSFRAMLGVRQGGADVARRMCACLSASLAKTAWNMNHIRLMGGGGFRRGTLTRPLGWKTSPSPRRQGAVLLPWCYVTAPARRKYGWWCLQGMNQRWREGFITPQAPVTEGKSQLSSNDSNEAVAFAI